MAMGRILGGVTEINVPSVKRAWEVSTWLHQIAGDWVHDNE